jgi:predicted aconitase with swiveling domain
MQPSKENGRQVKMEISLRGHIASKGKAEGEALVCHGPFKLFFPFGETSGVISEIGHELYGKSVKDKVIVCSCGCGPSYYGLYLMQKWGISPKAIVALKPYHQLIDDAIFTKTPMVYGFDHNLLDIVETGDYVVVDGDNGTVAVSKKS